MNYQNIYESLITKRQQKPAKGYTETHHILPKSWYGPDDPSNLVVLTVREHWSLTYFYIRFTETPKWHWQ